MHIKNIRKLVKINTYEKCQKKLVNANTYEYIRKIS